MRTIIPTNVRVARSINIYILCYDFLSIFGKSPNKSEHLPVLTLGDKYSLVCFNISILITFNTNFPPNSYFLNSTTDNFISVNRFCPFFTRTIINVINVPPITLLFCVLTSNMIELMTSNMVTRVITVIRHVVVTRE